MAEARSEIFVGIDAGTTGAKVGLFDASGKALGVGYSDYPCIHPHPGWVEQDMETVWRGLCRASQMAVAAADAPLEAIRSIGLSSQRGSFVLLDGEKRPLAPSVVWNDSRAEEIEPLLAQTIGAERFRAITGMPISASWAIAKLAWLKRRRPELIDRARLVCNGQEYFLRRLGADRIETDPASPKQ